MTDDRRLEHAQLDWGAPAEGLAPRSIFFNDIYFSGDGPAETLHTFLQGNDLPARFDGAARFTIGELGFGTGLNFLVAWDVWRRTAPKGARLRFFSVEAFPLNPDDLKKAHTAWPALAEFSDQLIARHPPHHRGFHRLDFDDASLTLYLGDARDGLAQLDARIDAWFLDGFAPDRNPEMWAPELLAELPRLSNAGATFATFTVAGAVRRAMQDAGFAVEKRPGYGRKREMLTGRLAEPSHAPKRAPWFTAPAPLPAGARIAIIGAGIAGASLAHALAREGFHPSVYEASAPASGASGNPAGLIMPRLDADAAPAGRFHASAYLHTLDLFTTLNADGGLFTPCGVLHHATGEKERARQEKIFARSALPEGWLERRDGGLFYPHAGIVDPPAFVRALLGDAPLIPERVVKLSHEGDGWTVETDNSAQCFDAVVIANAMEALRFAQLRSLPLSGSAGQIDWFQDAPAPPHAHAFGAYAAPAPKGGVVICATYAPVLIGEQPSFTAEATNSNIEAVRRAAPDLAAELDPHTAHPRASVRCTTPDRLPIVGPVPDWGFYAAAYDGLREGRKQDYPPAQVLPGLYVLTGLGSRGLVTAPFAAAMIAADMAGAPAPVDAAVAEALHPARFFIRDLKRAKASSASLHPSRRPSPSS